MDRNDTYDVVVQLTPEELLWLTCKANDLDMKLRDLIYQACENFVVDGMLAEEEEDDLDDSSDGLKWDEETKSSINQATLYKVGERVWFVNRGKMYSGEITNIYENGVYGQIPLYHIVSMVQLNDDEDKKEMSFRVNHEDIFARQDDAQPHFTNSE